MKEKLVEAWSKWAEMHDECGEAEMKARDLEEENKRLKEKNKSLQVTLAWITEDH